MDSVKRIFIGVDIPDAARRLVTDYIDGLRGEFGGLRVGWERPEKLHITFKFLGDVENEQISEVVDVVKNAVASIRYFTLKLAGTGIFPPRSNPRILWLGISDLTGELKTISESVELSCEELGYKKDLRKFSPHLTIARIREPQKALSLAGKHLANKFKPVGFDVREIVIYESELRPTGSVYSKVAAVPLL